MITKKFEHKNELEDQLRDEIISRINESIIKRGSASVLFSGGSTPIGLFQKLSEISIDWSKVTIGLVDDRMVAQNDEFSNAKLILESFVSKLKTSPHFYPLVIDPNNETKNSAEISDTILKIGTPDITILGMGDDGHFASLFPEDEKSKLGLSLTNKASICYTNAPKHPVNRISFTWSLLKKSNHIFLFITGENKLSLIEDSNKQKGLPIEVLLSDQEIEPVLYWAP